MISVHQARRFANKHFPEAPEKLTQELRIPVHESPMDGCDGWCLTRGTRAIIRINSNLSPSRKRFTLAHELSHLILGVPTIIGESVEDILGSSSAEERRVNELASELLVPTNVVKAMLPDLPVVAAALTKLAKKANISQLAAAIRVCNLAAEIGLVNASVALFDGDRVRWQWSQTLTMSNATAARLLEGARNTAPQAFRHNRNDGNVIVASTIENAFLDSATLFVQLLPAACGLNLSREEQRTELECALFVRDEHLRRAVQGCFGAFKPKVQQMSLDRAEAAFWDRYHNRFAKTSMNTNEGRKYVRLRLSEWC